MKNGITELVFIIDKSGSMAGLEADTVGGFNAMIEKQKKEEGNAYVTTVLFSSKSEILHDRTDISAVNGMTHEEYCVGGCTALLDAIGETVHHISNVHKYARKEDVPEKTIFLITTDGMENASSKYNADDVKRMISQSEEKGWEFIFVAANIDAVQTAKSIGIREDRAADYHQSKKGTSKLYCAMNEAVTSLRRSGSVCGEWSKKLKEEE